MIDTVVSHRPQAVAEWAPCRAVWVAWPHDREFWGARLADAKREIVELCSVLATGGSDLEVLVNDDEVRRELELRLPNSAARISRVSYDDVWLRDTGPVFARAGSDLVAGCFRFNGWGGKFPCARDRGVARAIARLAGAKVLEIPLVLEGGAVEFDGEGTCLTTDAVALNGNRGRSISRDQVADALRTAFDVSKVIWLERGLLGDHTDGHIDNIARFVAPGRVLCSVAHRPDDPNAALYAEIGERLRGEFDAAGRKLEVVDIPSPGLLRDVDGNPMPASYLNFCLADGVAVVPIFGSPYDSTAVQAIAECFPQRKVVGLSASAVLSGGGAFHCMTANEPRCAATASGA